MRALFDVVAPIRCVGCGQEGDGELCADCATLVHVLIPPLCARCGVPVLAAVVECRECRDLEGFARARSVVAFAEPARSLTLALKRRGRRQLARSVSGLLGDLVVAHGLAGNVVTFVPTGRRARGRGFDHAELIASSVAGTLGAPMRRLVVRVGDGPRQADVAFVDRRTNVGGRFAALPTTEPVLLVDDVFTTGATVEACATALLSAGAPRVDVVTWARTLRRRAS